MGQKESVMITDRLIPAIALAFTVGCGTNGDFVPYSELPTVTLEGIPNSESMVSSSQGSPGKSGASTAEGELQPTGADETKSDAPKDQSASIDANPENSKSAPVGSTPVVQPASVTSAAGDSTSTSKTEPAQPLNNTAQTGEARTVVSGQTGLVGPADVPQIENTAGEVKEIKLLIPEKRFLPERGTKAIRVSYDDIDLLKILNMEPVPSNASEYFPGWLQELNGKPIRIRGFMYPTFEATGLTEFTMARDNGICCFVRKPKIYDVIGVTLAEGATTDYIEGRPFDIEGTFHIEPEGDEHGLYRLYRISNAHVVR